MRMVIWVISVGRMQKRMIMKTVSCGQFWKYWKWNSLRYLSTLITARVVNIMPVKCALTNMNIQAIGKFLASSTPREGKPNLTMRLMLEEMLRS